MIVCYWLAGWLCRAYNNDLGLVVWYRFTPDNNMLSVPMHYSLLLLFCHRQSTKKILSVMCEVCFQAVMYYHVTDVCFYVCNALTVQCFHLTAMSHSL